jgi:cytochrome P450
MTDVARRPPFHNRQRPPAPAPPRDRLGPISAYRTLRANSIALWREEVYEAPIAVDRAPYGEIIVVNAPDAIRRVFLDNVANYRKDDLQLEKLAPAVGRSLLTAEGQDWKLQRQTVASLFQPGSVSAYLPQMTEAVEAVIARCADAARAGAPIDMAREMQKLTYDVISATVFSNELEAGADVMGRAITHYFEALGRIDLWDFLNVAPPAWLPRLSLLRARPAIRVFRGEVQRLLDRRRTRQAAGKAPPQDLLTLLMAARDTDTGSALSDAVIHDNLVTFMTAGHETTANALTWTLFLLSAYPSAFAWRRKSTMSSARGSLRRTTYPS